MAFSDFMPPAMFGGMILFILLGFPVAFTLAAVGLLFGVVGIEAGYFATDFLQALPFRFFGVISNDLLLSIPFFTFMGAVLERCRLAEDLQEGTGQLRRRPRRTRLCGHSGRRVARSHHGHGCGLSDRHGHHLPARDDALCL